MEGVPCRPSRRACELLQLLSLQPDLSLGREQVVEALWPHLDPEAGHANLRKAAHHARQLVGVTGAVVLRGGRVLLLPGRSVHCDAVTFERCADAALAGGEPGACRAAAQLYTGDLLADALYETWAEAPRSRLREKYLRLLRQAGWFERLVQEDPTDESACLPLMRAEVAAGRRTAALECYFRLRDQLHRNLGVAPSPGLQAFYRECLAGARAGAAAGIIQWRRVGMDETACCRMLEAEARRLGFELTWLPEAASAPGPGEIRGQGHGDTHRNGGMPVQVG